MQHELLSVLQVPERSLTRVNTENSDDRQQDGRNAEGRRSGTEGGSPPKTEAAAPAETEAKAAPVAEAAAPAKAAARRATAAKKAPAKARAKAATPKAAATKATTTKAAPAKKTPARKAAPAKAAAKPAAKKAAPARTTVKAATASKPAAAPKAAAKKVAATAEAVAGTFQPDMFAALQESIEMVVETNRTAVESAMELQETTTSFVQSRLAASAAVVDRMGSAEGLTEIADLQREYAESAFEAWTTHFGVVSTTYQGRPGTRCRTGHPARQCRLGAGPRGTLVLIPEHSDLGRGLRVM